MGRSAIALFIVSFIVIFIAFWTGVAGCWRRSPGNITATAILILLSCEYLHRLPERLTDPNMPLKCFFFF